MENEWCEIKVFGTFIFCVESWQWAFETITHEGRNAGVYVLWIDC